MNVQYPNKVRNHAKPNSSIKVHAPALNRINRGPGICPSSMEMKKVMYLRRTRTIPTPLLGG